MSTFQMIQHRSGGAGIVKCQLSTTEETLSLTAIHNHHHAGHSTSSIVVVVVIIGTVRKDSSIGVLKIAPHLGLLRTSF